ncbi:asparagine synthase (glutamine-hydrolyzing) [Flavobacteriaceae bacterium R38]|nr:asparagine synthase (glutamine-hydrolyzing) [Flavobacteriaceae bacterium R38]
MCGINGIILKKSTAPGEINTVLTKMNNLIIHRGPDQDGFFSEENDTFSIGMSMRRLSIIDLASGKQPITTDDNKITIVFNGEIYNYQILKSKLESEGVSFKTSSDTEVILKLYEKYGVESFQWLDGMFGFSIYDTIKNKVYIARDFFGEKPLYYTNDTQKFIWASELKSLVNVADKKFSISLKGLNLYFRLTYIPAPYTIYEDVYKLEANHYIEYDTVNHKHTIHEIHQELQPEEKNISLESARNDVKDLVYESVLSRSISDVPLGTFLSGGVDSSVVSLCLSQAKESKINTFSIGFKKETYDETDKSRLVAKLINSNHHEFIIGEEDIEKNVHEILLNFDEPFADSSALPTYLVSNKTRAKVTVALTGDGGDEVFGGYNKYYVGKINTKYTSIVPKGFHNSILKLSAPFLITKDDNRGYRYRIKKMLNTIDYSGGYYWDIISLANNKKEASLLLKPHWHHEDIFEDYKKALNLNKPQTLNDFRRIDKHISLEGDMLVKVDRTSMLNSLECRAPFLNKKIWDYTNSLPENLLMKGWDKKFILKEAFKSQFPDKFLDKSKSGFGVPVGDWLKSTLRKELEKYIDIKALEKQNIFNVEKIVKLVKDHLSGKIDNTFSVWSFYCFQKWYFNNYMSDY